MKKIIVSAVAIFFSLSISAQTGFYFGGAVTPSNTWIVNQNAYGLTELEYRLDFGIAAGVLLGYSFSDNVGLQVEGRYATMGQSYESEAAGGVEIQREVEVNYFQVPLLLKGTFGDGTVRTYAELGPQLSFLSDAKITGQINDPDAKKRFEEINYGMALGFGLNIVFSEYFSLAPGLRFTYDFSDMNTENYRVLNSRGIYDPSHNASIGLNIAALFYITGSED